METIRQSLYGINLTPYLCGTLVFAVFFVLLMRRRVRIMNPRRLWILPTFAWIITLPIMADAPPRTGTQVMAFVVLAVTGFGIGVLLCLSDSLKRGPTSDAFTHISSLLSTVAKAMIGTVLIVYNPFHFWPEVVFIAGYITGHRVCLWRWSEILRSAPQIFYTGT